MYGSSAVHVDPKRKRKKINEQNNIEYEIWAVVTSGEDKQQSQTLWLTLLAPSWREDGEEDHLLKRYNGKSCPHWGNTSEDSIYGQTKMELEKCACLFTVIIIPHRNKEHEFVTHNLFTSSL